MDATLNQIFSQYTTVVSAKVLPTKPGLEVCTAFVRCVDAASARQVIDTLDGKIPNGLLKPVVIRLAGEPAPPYQGNKARAKGKDYPPDIALEKSRDH